MLHMYTIKTPNYDYFQEKSENAYEETEKSNIPNVDTTYHFLEWYESLCDSHLKSDDTPYEAYHKQLDDRRNECVALTNQVFY